MKQLDAQKIIRTRAAVSLSVVYIHHAQLQMRKRGIDAVQVIRCLQRGLITEGPYRAIKTGQWRCNVDARAGGDLIRVVVEISDKPALLEVITVIGLE